MTMNRIYMNRTPVLLTSSDSLADNISGYSGVYLTSWGAARCLRRMTGAGKVCLMSWGHLTSEQSSHQTASTVQYPQLHVCTSTPQSCKIRRSQASASCLSGSCPDSARCRSADTYLDPIFLRNADCLIGLKPGQTFRFSCHAAALQRSIWKPAWGQIPRLVFDQALKVRYRTAQEPVRARISACTWGLRPEQRKVLGLPTKWWSPEWKEMCPPACWWLHNRLGLAFETFIPAEHPVSQQWCVNKGCNVGVLQSGLSMLCQLDKNTMANTRPATSTKS